MAARSRGVVEMMTRPTTTHPGGVNWKGLESGKLWGKKKYIYTYIYTYIHIYTHGGIYMYVRWGWGLESGKL
jgi:hypothetical protein